MKSSISNADLMNTDDSYMAKVMKDKYFLKWKYFPNLGEIRFIIKAKTKSYISLGWRPLDITPECQAFPVLGDIFDPESEPEGEWAEPEAEQGHHGSSEEEHPEPEAEHENHGSSEEAYAEPETEHDHYGSSEEENAEPEAEQEMKSSEEEDAEPEGYAIAEEGCSSEEEAVEEPEHSSHEHEGHVEGHMKMKKVMMMHKYQPYSKTLHEMDCSDVVIGMARGQFSRVYDAYTRDRSTPLADEYYFGQDDLTGACGMEDEDGYTTIGFQRRLATGEPADHDIQDEIMYVIWAFGQDAKDYNHRPLSGLEIGSPLITDFYREDEVKYHGRANRGHADINFLENYSQNENQSNCSIGEFRYPARCEDMSCEYHASWVNEGDGFIKVTVRQKGTKENQWVAIGFSNTEMMVRHIFILIDKPKTLWNTYQVTLNKVHEIGKKNAMHGKFCLSLCPKAHGTCYRSS